MLLHGHKSRVSIDATFGTNAKESNVLPCESGLTICNQCVLRCNHISNQCKLKVVVHLHLKFVTPCVTSTHYTTWTLICKYNNLIFVWISTQVRCCTSITFVTSTLMWRFHKSVVTNADNKSLFPFFRGPMLGLLHHP